MAGTAAARLSSPVSPSWVAWWARRSCSACLSCTEPDSTRTESCSDWPSLPGRGTHKLGSSKSQAARACALASSSCRLATSELKAPAMKTASRGPCLSASGSMSRRPSTTARAASATFTIGLEIDREITVVISAVAATARRASQNHSSKSRPALEARALAEAVATPVATRTTSAICSHSSFVPRTTVGSSCSTFADSALAASVLPAPVGRPTPSTVWARNASLLWISPSDWSLDHAELTAGNPEAARCWPASSKRAIPAASWPMETWRRGVGPTRAPTRAADSRTEADTSDWLHWSVVSAEATLCLLEAAGRSLSADRSSRETAELRAASSFW